jgi:ABC-2 type transport system permease protein
VWINPLGWMTETRPAAGNHWWPLLPAVALTAVLLGAAFVLHARRDIGQGAIAARPGPGRGTARSTGRLALRLNRGSLIVWAAAFVALGFVFGRLATSVDDLMRSNAAITSVLAAGATTPDALLGAFLVTILSMIGILAAVPGVQVMLRVRSEELDDRVEPVLATAVTRLRYFAGNVVVALAGPTAYLLVAGSVIALLVSGAGLGLTFGQVLVQAIAVAPAVWTITAIPVAVVGARPQVTLAAWLGVVASFALTLLGPTFGLPDWVLGISPFWHVPRTTTADPELTGLLGVSLFTLLFAVVGFAGFRRRDLAR